jgi:hypothetical protein
MAQMKKTPKYASPTGKFIGTKEADKAKELKRIANKKPTYTTGAKPSTAAAVAKRFNITAREARDIATALGTVAGRAVTGTYGANDPTAKGKGIKNLKKQIKEVGVAAVKGKKGTTSDIEGRKYETPKGSGRYKVDRTYGYETGKKRK